MSFPLGSGTPWDREARDGSWNMQRGHLGAKVLGNLSITAVDWLYLMCLTVGILINKNWYFSPREENDLW